MYNLLQKLFAEFLGTFAVVFFGAGAICADFQLRCSGGLGMPVGIALANGSWCSRSWCIGAEPHFGRAF